ncbi:MAG TPA: GNAT family N-acetyltransferase [Actinomycetota bacterium]|nr:GNAT family N-acetyltransferase [Actinomycetota bacterium]
MSPDRKGKGVGGALYRSLLEVLARQGYRQAIAGTALPNPTSMRLHKSLGFQLAGVQRKLGWKLGAWHDVAWWQCELVPGTDAPAPPVGVDRLPPGVLAEALESGLPRHGVRPELRKE